ncbi:MAG TPA: tetratricopeptide repeat protein, partial [Cyclobacteriaceae bacterium]|nr:tetratricopeptide repeat protein [Cyclobacteriaceae bacterium]
MKKFFFLLLLLYAADAYCQEKDTQVKNSKNTSAVSLDDKIKNYQTLITSLWLNHPDSALIYARQLLRLTEHENDAGHAVAIRLLGGVHLYKGNYDSALICSKLAYDLSVRTQDSVLISSALNNIGFTQYHFGNYSRALEILLKALAMKYKVHNNYGLAQTINNIGLVYSKLKDYQKAREYFNKALAISENMRDNNQRLYSLNNIGHAYLNESNFDQAEKYFVRALDASRNITNNNWLATTYSGLGQVRLRTKDVKQATRLFNISLGLRKEISDLNGISEIYYLLSQVDATENRFDSAFIKLHKSQLIANKIGSKSRQLENFELYKSLFVKTHRVDSAMYYQNLFFELKEGLFNERLARELADIQIKLLEEESASLLSERDARLQKRYQVIIILVVIALFSSILGGSFYYNYSRKKKLSQDLMDKNQKIIHQNKEINKQREALMLSNTELARAKDQIDMQHDLLQELNKKLQVTVDLRTRQLETVNEELKYSNLELDNFIYRSSHDIRGPLIRLTGIC